VFKWDDREEVESGVGSGGLSANADAKGEGFVVMDRSRKLTVLLDSKVVLSWMLFWIVSL
jgi:hypothetical protein